MKKIILVFEGTHFPESSFEFALKLNKLQPLLLTGVFLPRTELADLWSYEDGMDGHFIPLVENEESELVQQNIERFKQLCKNSRIDYVVHKDFYHFALPELKKESRFADLLILSSEVFYKNLGHNISRQFLDEALNDVACPVLLVPEKFHFPESVILAYDGSEDSVFAIKQFAYLFPELARNETLLVYVDEDKEKDFPDKIQIQELASRHFSKFTLFRLNREPKKHFKAWLSAKKSAMLVSGSYGRSGLAQLFRKSFINEVINDHRVPVFIAHK